MKNITQKVKVILYFNNMGIFFPASKSSNLCADSLISASLGRRLKMQENKS